MKRTKLEIYVDILNVLAHGGPMKLTQIINKANVNYSKIKQYIDFLTKLDTVEEQTFKKEHRVFAVTQRGIAVLKYFRELTQLPLVVEKA